MTLRSRLTLVSLLVLTIVLTAFGGGVYVLLNHTLHGNLDSTLRARAQEALRGQPFGLGGGPTITGVYLQFVWRTGTIVSESGVEVLPIDDRTRDLANGKAAGVYYRDVKIGELPMRLMVARVNDSGQNPIGAIMVAASRLGIEETLRRLRLLLLWAGAVGLGLAGTLSWLAARAALRPVEEVALAATGIGETGDLSRRVVPGGEDELGQLTKAFNGMLDQLESAHAELERTLEGQRRFVADASHELRTPLTTMRGNLEVIQANPAMAPAERTAAIRDAIEEGERMSRLVEDLLALARADARAPVPTEPVSLAGIAREGVALAQSGANGTAPSVSIHAEDGLTVAGSPDLLRRLVANLVENAIKFTPPSGSIAVALAGTDGWATLTVADTGAGMSQEELTHAFDRFWRSDTARGERGSGLGLAIVKAVVEEHGGSITAESMQGQGTTFTVTLPLSS